MKKRIAAVAALVGAGVLAATVVASGATDPNGCVLHVGNHCKRAAMSVSTTTTSSTTVDTTTTTTTTAPPTTTVSSGGGGVVNQTTTWNCRSAVNISSVTVTIPQSGSGDAVYLRAGCSGYIGKITIVQYHGDGLKIDAASNLTIGEVDIRCYAHTAGKHQDGIQVLGGGENVTIQGGYVGCYSANNSQTWINPATANGVGAKNVLIENVTYDPAGLESGAPEYTYGAGGAYGMANISSIDSGFENDDMISNPNHHPCQTGSSAVNPVWVNDTFPAGDACP